MTDDQAALLDAANALKGIATALADFRSGIIDADELVDAVEGHLGPTLTEEARFGLNVA